MSDLHKLTKAQLLDAALEYQALAREAASRVENLLADNTNLARQRDALSDTIQVLQARIFRKEMEAVELETKLMALQSGA